jgi:single-strand DNA-binding protein
MLAKITGLFRLTRDAELTYSQNGVAVLKMGLVNSEKFKDKETTLFIDAVAFNKPAEILNQYAGKKGTQIYLTGKLQTEQWVDQNQQKRSKISMTIEGFDFVSTKEQGQQAQTPQQNGGQQQNYNQGQQQQYGQQQTQQPAQQTYGQNNQQAPQGGYNPNNQPAQNQQQQQGQQYQPPVQNGANPPQGQQSFQQQGQQQYTPQQGQPNPNQPQQGQPQNGYGQPAQQPIDEDEIPF